MFPILLALLLFATIVYGLFRFGRRYEKDEPISYRSMSADTPVAPMSENNMPDSNAGRLEADA